MDRISRCWPSPQINYDPPVHKVVFFSSAPIWVPFLQKLQENTNFNVVGVVTMPDKPVWRWQKMQPNIIKKEYLRHCEEWSNPLYKNDNIRTPTKISPDKSQGWKDFHDRLVSLNADWFVVIAYGKIMPTKILDIPKIMPLNIHWSLLPQYRWASPIQSVFLDHKNIENKLQTWITLIKMVKKMDAWPSLWKLIFDIPLNRTSLDIIETMQTKWPEFLIHQMLNFTKWYVPMKKQDLDKVTFCKKFEKADWEINPWENNTLDIYNKYRAFYLRPKIFFILPNWKRVIIEKIILCRDLLSVNPQNNTQKNIKKSLFLENNELNPIIKEITLKPEWKWKTDRQSFKNWYLR